MIGIGIDTGGTCTDAVAYNLDAKKVLAFAKSRTTHEHLEIGIGESIGKLPRNLIDQASYISLSTTLATNACVENKGGRVCLIFIGVDPESVEETYGNYGFESTDFIRYIDGDATKGIEPDWAKLDEMLPEIFDEYDSIAVSQLFPRKNNGRYEKDARDRIRSKKDITVVCGYELSSDLNVIKRGAGALLNARLIPVIAEFFRAVHHVLEEKKINLPFLIMRSDGSLVSEQYSMQYPVETLLCGPTASTKGASELLPETNAIVVDMGGTTSDIALIKGDEPKINADGVSVGQWQTLVRGIDVDTFALGGDTHVIYSNRGISLDYRRVMPISLLAGMHPSVLEEIRFQTTQLHGSTTPRYEHLMLMKDITNQEKYYSDTEVAICHALQNGPRSICQVAEAIGSNVAFLNTKRLEKEGVVQRSGFTPSDAMLLMGDRSDPNLSVEAAELVINFITKSIHCRPGFVVPEVYRLVKERLFCNIVRILWLDAQGNRRNLTIPDNLEDFAKVAFAQSATEGESCFFRQAFKTDATLLGVGAPIHVFIEDVAKALGTNYKVSDYSGVTNALGALLGEACVYETVYIEPGRSRALSEGDDDETTFIVLGDAPENFESRDDAVKRAEEIAMERAKAKAALCGASDVYSVTCKAENKSVKVGAGTIQLGASVTACARGKYTF